MKHLLIILISFLLLSSPVIGDSHKGETLYRWETSSGWVWKGFGDKETHPKYKGEVENGVPNGLGFLIFPNGDKYVGEYKDGKRNGRGTFTYNDGKYVGEWKDGEQHGQGTITWSDGGKYVGEWKDGIPNGQGTFTFSEYDKNGNLSDGKKYVGSWKDGEPWSGQGTYTWSDGGKYIGDWKDGKPWNGKSYDKDGKYKWKYVNGK